MRNQNSDFVTNKFSHQGTQNRNKDFYGYTKMDNYGIWIIGTSYDEDPAVNSAELAAKIITEQFYQKPTLKKRKLVSYILEAHRQLKVQSLRVALKASIMVVVSDYKRIRYAHVGNCHLNIFRGSKIFHQSIDQSMYQELVEKEENQYYPQIALDEGRNLFDYLGKPGIAKLHVSVSKKMVLETDDTILMTTWGFWEKISMAEMLDAFEESGDPLSYLSQVTDLFLSKHDSTVVNSFTVASITINKVFVEKDNKRFWIKIAVIIGIIVVIILFIVLFFTIRNNNRRNDRIITILSYEDKGDLYTGDENYERAQAEYEKSVLESDGLKERKGSKGTENEQIKERLSIKQKYTEYMLSGYDLLSSGDYVGAMKAFERALKEAKYHPEFIQIIDVNALEALIVTCEDYELIKQYLDFARLKLELGDYEGAIEDCNKARTLARQNSDRIKEMEAIALLNDSNAQKEEDDKQAEKEEAQKEEQDKEEKRSVAQELELEAQKALLEKDYAGALSFYEEAINYYTESGDTAGILLIESKKIEVGLAEQQDYEEDLLMIAADYMLSGDSYLEAQWFNSAIEYYNYAKNIYVELNHTDLIIVINNKIQAVNNAKKEQENSIKTLEVEELVNEGDRYLLDYQYANAIENFKQAKTLYQAMHNVDMVLEMERRIRNAEELRAEARQRILEAAAQTEET